MDIDLLLEDLLLKYNLSSKNRKITIYEEYLKAYINKQIDCIPKELRIAIWGAGEHTSELLEIINKDDINIVCIIDKNTELQGDRLDKIIIVSPEKIQEYKIDIVIVSSPKYQKDIIYELKKNQIKYINIYKILEDYNIEVQPWYTWGKNKFSVNHYYNYSLGLFLVRKLYENESCKDKKRTLLIDLIKEYLRTRDFIYAKEFINIYIEGNYKDGKKYAKFLTELDELLLKIKKISLQRNNKSFITIICDGLRCKEIEDAICDDIELPFIKDMCNNSVFYENSIANSTHTRPCMDALLTRKLVMDDKRYKRRKFIIDAEESKLISGLLNNEYKIYNDNITRITGDNINIKNMRSEHDIFECCTKQFWRMLSYFCEFNTQKIFYIMHFHETHYSFLCNYHEKQIKMPDTINLYLKEISVEDAKIQYMECLKYLDKQFEFYLNMLPKDVYKIVTSDHGQSFGENNSYTQTFTWYDEIIHTPLFINSSRLTPLRRQELFDKRNFDVLILSLVENDKVPNINVDAVKIQRDVMYSKTYTNNKELINSVGRKFVDSFKIIRTLNEKYVVYGNGKEELYVLPNENKNVIETKEGKKIAMKIAKLDNNI